MKIIYLKVYFRVRLLEKINIFYYHDFYNLISFSNSCCVFSSIITKGKKIKKNVSFMQWRDICSSFSLSLVRAFSFAILSKDASARHKHRLVVAAAAAAACSLRFFENPF